MLGCWPIIDEVVISANVQKSPILPDTMVDRYIGPEVFFFLIELDKVSSISHKTVDVKHFSFSKSQ